MSGAGAAAATAALLLLCHIPGGALGEYSSQSLATFVDTMLAEYDRETPPAPRTLLSIALDVRHATVDDVTSTMLLLADVKMSWNDSRVSWNASAWAGASVLVSAERLWAPDVALVSAGGWHFSPAAVLRARLSSTGAVSTVHRLALSVPIPLALYEWPRDVQRAVFKFASRAHSQDEIDLQITDNAQSVVVESGGWEVQSVVGSLERWRRGERDAVPVAQYTVTAARRGAARAAAAAALLAAAALTLLAAAALPYHQRPPLAAAAAFLAAMWLISAMSQLPSAGSTPRVVRVMCALCVAAAAAGAGAALAARLAARTQPPPPPLRALLGALSAHVRALAPDPDSESGKSDAWQAVARLFDAVVVALLVLTVIVLCLVQLL